MKVGFNARLLSSPELRGWNRYAVNLLAELSRMSVDLVLYSDRALHPAHTARLAKGSYRVSIPEGKTVYAYWEQVWLSRACAADRVDLLHSPFNYGLPWMTDCPRVLTLHDAIDPIYYWPRESLRQRFSRSSLGSRFRHWSARRRAHRLITPSAHAMREIVEKLGVDRERIDVVHEGADPIFQEPVTAADRARVLGGLGLQQTPYLFYVGGWEERKNVPLLVEAFARVADALPREVQLVLAGGSIGASEYGVRLAAQARDRGIGDRVRLLGRVADGDLPALYAGALAFVYPSRYEGFGLQLCEAMATGCPVIAARAGSLPEVLGSGGELFSSDDARELGSLLHRVASEPAFRADLADRARKRALDFSWRRTATETIEVYRKVMTP